MTPRIYWMPAQSADYEVRRDVPVIAIVNHRMVGHLAGTDATFMAGDRNRPVSTTFGVGMCTKHGPVSKPCIHQYVRIDDVAFGNGNYDPSGVWDDFGYPVSQLNDRTINIEHHDNGHLPSRDPRKGIVPTVVQDLSIQLQALLLRGDIVEWQKAGIVYRDPAMARRVAAQLRAIEPGPRTILNHNDIAGRLKPYCWKPWAQDRVGFPAARYISNIRALSATSTPSAAGVDNVFERITKSGTFTIKAGTTPRAFRPKEDGSGFEVVKTWVARDVDSSASFDYILRRIGGSFSPSSLVHADSGWANGLFVATSEVEERVIEPDRPYTQDEVDSLTAGIRTELSDMSVRLEAVLERDAKVASALRATADSLTS